MFNFQKKLTLSLFNFKIGEIDNMNEKYGAEVQIVAKWHVFDEVITQYDPKKHWNPMLFVQNTLNNVKEQIKYDVVKEKDHCTVIETRVVKSDFWERLELHNVRFHLIIFH